MSMSGKKTQKESWFKGLNREFKKIVWPDQETVVKQTVSVTVISILLGAVIAILDFIIKWGLSFII